MTNVEIRLTPEIKTLINSVVVDPWWIVGLTAGEGCFIVHVQSDSSYRLGYRVQINFSISLTVTSQH